MKNEKHKGAKRHIIKSLFREVREIVSIKEVGIYQEDEELAGCRRKEEQREGRGPWGGSVQEGQWTCSREFGEGSQQERKGLEGSNFYPLSRAVGSH